MSLQVNKITKNTNETWSIVTSNDKVTNYDVVVLATPMTDDKQTLIFDGLELDFPGKFHQTVATLGTVYVFTQTFQLSNLPVRFTDTFFGYNFLLIRFTSTYIVSIEKNTTTMKLQLKCLPMKSNSKFDW